MTSEQARDDALTEFCIDLYYRRLMAAKDEPEQRRWCDLLTTWVKRRSPERVRQMEREKGLA